MFVKAVLKKIILSTFPSIIKNRLYKPYTDLSMMNIANSVHDAELILLKHLLNSTSIFFDIGCNKGTYAYFAGKIVVSNQLYLFEPEKELFFQLKQIFKKANVFNLAMSNKEGVQQFKIPFVNGVIDKSLSTLEVKSIEKNETKQIIYEVRTSTIDTFTKVHNVFPNLIKIDVEGHEQHVLEGARSYIEKHLPQLIIEIEQRHHPNTPVDKVFNDLIHLGYHCFYFSKTTNSILSYDNKMHLLNNIAYFGTKDYVNNYIFIHTSQQADTLVSKINHALKLELNGKA
jgi:FkbM family methyltransferase